MSRILIFLVFIASTFAQDKNLNRVIRAQAPAGMVRIPAGCFNMGSNGGESDEKPMHKVCLSSFAIDKYEVTNAQFQASQGNNPHANDGTCYVFNGTNWEQRILPSSFRGDQQPVVCVDWNQAKSYCESQGKRLPTEAEWEYAVRAGSATEWYFGNDEDSLDAIAWYNGNSGNQTHPVGQKQPNAWGLYDMSGNVWEWTSDWYGDAYYGQSPSQDPQGPSSGSDRVYRGGSWTSFPSKLLSATRLYFEPSYPGYNLGFRCVSR